MIETYHIPIIQYIQNMLQEVADSFGLEISTPINPVST